VQPLQPKQMGPDYGKSQHENHSHSKTRLPDYHVSAAIVTNSAFYSNCVTGCFSIWTVVYLALSTYNTYFVALAVITVNLVQGELLLCERLSFGLTALLFRLGW